jgi:hypothetical protein
MLSQLDCRIFGLESIKGQYEFDADCKDVFVHCKEGGRACKKYVLNGGYLFRANRLCIPVGSARLLLLQEAHGGGLMGAFWCQKDRGCIGHTFLLFTVEERCSEIREPLHYMSKGKVMFESTWFEYDSSRSFYSLGGYFNGFCFRIA